MPETEKKSYSHTVHLPKTDFPMKGELPKREPQWLAFWEEKRVYQRLQDKDRPAYVLHDGPPYANGHTHIGHALNKTLKDMVVKSQSLLGRRAPYVPGWDCHGLPIEHALLKEMKMGKRGVKDINVFRGQARDFAQRFIDIQRSEFRRMGVLGEWERPYTTMSKEYEAAILDAFRRLYKAGYIYRGLKSVTWCVYCETALAEAEVEYKEKASPSVYVLLPSRKPGLPGALVWTTTPWTLPANVAVALHPDLKYAGVRVRLKDRAAEFLVAEARLEAVLKALGGELEARLGSWTGRQLVETGLVCETPFMGRDSKAVLADYVSAEDGTGLVHTAPGHGVDDFITGKKNGLPILCPVDGGGRYTAEAGDLAGKQIFEEGNPAVIETLTREGRMLAAGKVQHSYPHCWRCKNPIAFRATEQWFLNVSHEGLRERLLKAVSEVRWIPEQGLSRISAMVSSRPDWCISRQRLWGTPIPILRCAKCRAAVDDDAVLGAIVEKSRRDGTDFWFADWGKPVAWDFLPEGTKCRCGGTELERETDILDVWVDSGASWLAVLKPKGEHPCDIYLEGSDQHRGWFQSSLVLSVALEGKAPYRTVLTHGFVLDDKGRAMHKSLGNVVSPQQVIDKLGADVLRLWVALADYSDDVRLSDKLLEVPTETYRKLRNTFRYLLGNVCDYAPEKAPGELPGLERYMLGRLRALDSAVREAYASFAFRRAATLLGDFCNIELSSFYLDARKDALYTLEADDPVRRGAQAVMWECLERLLCLAAPILSFTCEEAWQELRKLAPALPESVFLRDLGPVPAGGEVDAALWELLLKVRGMALPALEALRRDKVIGSSLQARAVVSAAGEDYRRLAGFGAEGLAELLIVSEVELRQGEPGVSVAKAPGVKCPRCWRYRTDVGADPKDPALCARCARQLAA